MIADLDTLLTALYVELTDRIIPGRGFTRRGTVAGSAPTALAGRPRSLTGNSWLVRALVGDTPRVVRER